jgi:hypothetical protein
MHRQARSKMRSASEAAPSTFLASSGCCRAFLGKHFACDSAFFVYNLSEGVAAKEQTVDYNTLLDLS